jgi:hypothetical protein
MPFAILFYFLLESLVTLLLLLSIMLLLLEDGCGLCGGFRRAMRLMCAVNFGAGDCSQHRKDGNEQFGIEQIEHVYSV